MVNDQPIMEQLEELNDFFKDHKTVYIYGHDYTQLMIAKYLTMSKNQIAGFLVMKKQHCDYESGVPIIALNSLFHKKIDKNAGVIISTPDCEYNEVVNNLKLAGLNNYYFVTEFNKRTIPYKMTPRPKDRFWLEVNLADHCNLNCQMCDHFSPIAEKTLYDLDEFDKDMHRLADLMDGSMGLMKLQGGEPLLNDNLIDYIKITRKYFPDSKVWLFTAGVLLLKWENHKNGNLWQVCKDYNVEIQLTRYPINLDFEKMEEKAKQYGINVEENTNIGDRHFTGTKFSVRHPFDLDGKQEPFRFICCYQFNESIVMNHGKIYTCPMIPYVKHFNKYYNQDLKVTEADYIDIYKAKSYEEIAEFVTHRTEFCNYCATHLRTQHVWKQSDHDMSEWALKENEK